MVFPGDGAGGRREGIMKGQEETLEGDGFIISTMVVTALAHTMQKLIKL